MVAHFRCIILVVAVGCLSTGFAWGQPFEPIGDVAFYDGTPNGGRLSRVAPTTTHRIFASSGSGGVWRTLDGGSTWVTSTDGFLSLGITALAASSSDARIFAATSRPARLLRSTNGGNSFTEIVVPQVAFLHDAIWKLVIDPVHEGTLYALTTRGLLKSVDDGDSWVVVLPPDPGFVVDVAVLAGAQFQVLATRAGMLYRSPSGDASSFVLLPLPAPPDGEPPSSGLDPLLLAPVPGDAERVWVAYAYSGSAVYRSTDYGAAATFIARHERVFVRDRFAASADGLTLYSGAPAGGAPPRLHRHVGGGLSHSLVEGPYHSDVHAVTTTDSPPYVYVGTDGGLWRYHETLETWENLNGDIGNLLVYEARTARSDRDALVAGTQDNGALVYRGRDWVIAAPTDAGDGMLRTDDPVSGASFLTIASQAFVRIDGRSGLAYAYIGEPPACSPPSRGTFALDPTDPLLVCVARGKIVCARDPRHAIWCEETADLGFTELIIIDRTFAWAVAIGDRVMRTTSGVFGPWNDVTGDLPAGKLIGLDAPERGSPLRALVLWRPSGDVARVYETLNGGENWIQRGLPPVVDEGGLVLDCFSPPCADTPELGPQTTQFAVTFPGTLIPESWFVGTRAGLLESKDAGATWLTTDVPNTQISDIDTFGTNVTVATYGRGVFRRIAEPVLPEVEMVPIGPFWWMRHVPFEIDEFWASDAMADVGDAIGELRRLGQGGRRFRSGDEPHGPHDFLLTPGQPWLVRGTALAELPLKGAAVSAQPIALAPGWNPVGLVDPALASASALAADAAAQGIAIQAVLDGGMEQTWVAGEQGVAGGFDFGLELTEGYWVYACGDGGLWTPGAGTGQAASETIGPEGGSSAPSSRAPVGQVNCAGLDTSLDRLGLDLGQRLPGEFFTCLPQQQLLDGNDSIDLCDSVPFVDSDLQLDNFACDDQPLARGCAVKIQIREVGQLAPDWLTVDFDIRANGTAQDAQGMPCPVNAKADSVTLDVFLDVTVDPPIIDVKPLQFASQLFPLQQGCGASADQAIAQLVGDAARDALETRVSVAITGLGPTCLPDLPLPDMDEDGAIDCDDGCPFDPLKIDPGACGCGVVDDLDGDQVPGCAGDCNDQDTNAWSPPGDTGTLLLEHDMQTASTLLKWGPPAQPGATSVVYDVLVTGDAGTFEQGATCVETGDGNTEAVFNELPQPAAVLFFLVRATNACPDGLGSLGEDSLGAPRKAPDC